MVGCSVEMLVAGSNVEILIAGYSFDRFALCYVSVGVCYGV